MDREAAPAARTTNPNIGRPLRWGPLELRTNLLLAPVANYCDLAWRIVCREEGGVGLACTDLLSPQGLLRGTAHSLDLAATNERDTPLCMQLYGGDPDILSEGARWAIDHGAHAIDINMGCPVDKVTKKDGGSMLLCHPDRTVAMAERIVREVDRHTRGRVGVSAKLRLGWDSSCIVAPELARRLERVGIVGITLHGRTTEQKFKGSVDLDGIREVVRAVDRIPVLGNGDVTEPEHCLTMLERTGCAGVMIGRGSFSAPWLFRRCWAAQTSGDPGPEPSEAEKVELIRKYLRLMLAYRGAHYAMTHIRRRISWMGKRLGPCKPLREAVRLAHSPADVEAALDAFLAGGLRSIPNEDDSDDAQHDTRNNADCGAAHNPPPGSQAATLAH
jgi:tRNA-dihydrouridine synthase B